jgi:hypothetical protein
MLPDELEHEKLVEIRVEQGARDGVHLPVVIVRTPGKIDNHDELYSTRVARMGGRILRRVYWPMQDTAGTHQLE